MSRTIRRKQYTPWYVTTDYKVIKGTVYTVELSGDARVVAENKYHSDKYENMNNSPKHYRQMLNRKLRARERQALRTCLDFDELVMPVFIKDCAWYW